MKQRTIILGIGALIALAVSGVYGMRLYGKSCRQVEEWNEVAKATFDEALWMEVNKRAKTPIFHYSSEQHGTASLDTRMPDSVSVMSSAGFRKYKFDRYKYELSLIKEAEKRAMLTTLLSMYPLSIDTLVTHWDSLLARNSIPIKNGVRYVHTDLDLQNDTISSSVSKMSFDSLNVRYLGFRCEHELVGYVSCPFWLSFLSVSEWGFLLLPWCVWGLLFVFYAPLECFVRKKIIREKVVEKEVIVEKEIYMVDVQMDKVGIFHLPDGTVFDSFVGTLTKNGVQQRLQPQSVSLLKLFLRKEDRQVTSDEICMKLWGDTGYADRLRSAISRLRNDFKAVKSELIVNCSYGVYELIFPISSKGSEK